MIDIFLLSFAVHALASLVICARYRNQAALVFTLLSGWLLLPVGLWAEPIGDGFPWWISGAVLPSETLFKKATMVPALGLLLAVSFLRRRREIRPSLADFTMLGFCLLPLVHMIFFGQGRILDSAHLAMAWGASWLLGRLYLNDEAGKQAIIAGLALSGLAIAAITLLEVRSGPWLYQLVYAPHPFAEDGADRYIGHRGLGFMEHGNQLGVWAAAAAFAAIWQSFASAQVNRSPIAKVLALISLSSLLISQSVGAVLLFLLALFLAVCWSWRLIWPAFLLTGFCAIAMLATHLSGIIDLRWVAYHTAFGRDVMDLFQAIGRTSFLWRFAQDMKSLETLHETLLFGSGLWDWWRPNESRPWGLWMLILGYLGVLGLSLAWISVLTGPLGTLHRSRGQSIWQPSGIGFTLALLVLIGIADAQLNAFVFQPMILIAAAIVQRPPNQMQVNAPGH